MLIKKAGDISSSEITPKNLYMNRRKFLAGTAIAGAAALSSIGLRQMLTPSAVEANAKIEGIQKSALLRVLHR